MEKHILRVFENRVLNYCFNRRGRMKRVVELGAHFVALLYFFFCTYSDHLNTVLCVSLQNVHLTISSLQDAHLITVFDNFLQNF
jgi:hypothetical protein